MAKDKENILEPCAILSYDQENELEENMDQGIQGYQAFLYWLSFNKISNRKWSSYIARNFQKLCISRRKLLEVADIIKSCFKCKKLPKSCQKVAEHNLYKPTR
jgi:hypothetical protein